MTQILFILFCVFFPSTIKSQANKNTETSKQFFEEFTKNINDSIPSIGSFIVSKSNKIIYEQYFNGANKETIFNVKSVTKSITSILTGIAKDKGLLPNLNTTVLKILPEYDIPRNNFKNISNIEGKVTNDSIRKKVTLRHLMTMQGGFDYTENSQISRAMGFSSDPVKFILDYLLKNIREINSIIALAKLMCLEQLFQDWYIQV